MIFDWKDSGGDIITRNISGDEWICINDLTKPGPPLHSEDILVGAISNNYDEIIHCSDPKPSDFKQVVGITPKGWKTFEERL